MLGRVVGVAANQQRSTSSSSPTVSSSTGSSSVWSLSKSSEDRFGIRASYERLFGFTLGGFRAARQRSAYSAGTVRPRAHARRAATRSAMMTDSGRVLRSSAATWL